MSSASMALLAGSKKKNQAAIAAATAEELANPAAQEAQDAEETVQVSVDDMNDDELAALVQEHEIATPDNWDELDLAAKKTWLNEKFGDGDGQDAEPAPA